MSIVSVIIGILLGALVSGFVIWIVGKLGLGLEVERLRRGLHRRDHHRRGSGPHQLAARRVGYHDRRRPSGRHRPLGRRRSRALDQRQDRARPEG